MSFNPYQAPSTQKIVGAMHAPPDAEAIRRAHIKHEVSIKTILLLAVLAMVTFAMLTPNIRQRFRRREKIKPTTIPEIQRQPGSGTAPSPMVSNRQAIA